MGRVMPKLLPKNFAVIRFLVFWPVGRLCGGCFAISGISIFAFLSGIRFNGTCQAKLALGKFCGHSMLGFLSICRLCGGCFAISYG